jgi:hypothetical protein
MGSGTEDAAQETRKSGQLEQTHPCALVAPLLVLCRGVLRPPTPAPAWRVAWLALLGVRPNKAMGRAALRALRQSPPPPSLPTRGCGQDDEFIGGTQPGHWMDVYTRMELQVRAHNTQRQTNSHSPPCPLHASHAHARQQRGGGMGWTVDLSSAHKRALSSECSSVVGSHWAHSVSALLFCSRAPCCVDVGPSSPCIVQLLSTNLSEPHTQECYGSQL